MLVFFVGLIFISHKQSLVQIHATTMMVTVQPDCSNPVVGCIRSAIRSMRSVQLYLFRRFKKIFLPVYYLQSDFFRRKRSKSCVYRQTFLNVVHRNSSVATLVNHRGCDWFQLSSSIQTHLLLISWLASIFQPILTYFHCIHPTIFMYF